jgi:hypothetical protein
MVEKISGIAFFSSCTCILYSPTHTHVCMHMVESQYYDNVRVYV